MTRHAKSSSDRDLISRIALEKRNALAKTQTLAVTINTLLALSAAAILYLGKPDRRLVIWLGLTIAANGFRWCILRLKTLHEIFRITPERWLALITLGSLASGLAWSLAPALLMDFQSLQAPFVCIILCGLTAGAALQGGAYSPPVVALATPIALVLIIRFAMLSSPSGYLIAFDMLLYLLMIIKSSRGAESSFAKLAELRWRSDALAADLLAQNGEVKRSEERLFRLANHDPLTNIANRAAFTAEMEVRLERARRLGGSVSLLLLDLDHFKAINDTLGHGAGDDVLQSVARSIATHCLERCFVARLGGDEFAILLSVGPDDEIEGGFADEILDRVGVPLNIRGDQVHVGCSLGIASFPLDAATAEELLARADLALYAAKAAGRHAWRRFEPFMLSDAEVARDVERDLPEALDDGAVQAWFQPQVEILSGKLVGLEGLLRWKHPQLGWVRPPDAVAAALKLRRSESLTRHMLNQGCLAIKQLDQLGFDSVVVGVNISPREMPAYDLLALVREVLSSHDVEPRRLELEITEEAVIADESAIETLVALRALGVRLAMDDFGTGNSSIAYLRRLRVDRIKIDRSFVADIAKNEGDRNLLQAIVSMGRSLGVEVLAEGVETAEEALFLRSLGCHFAQGYLYGAALGPDALGEYLLEASNLEHRSHQPSPPITLPGRRNARRAGS